MDVLILGNGISRLSFDSIIRSWDGEVWGCNRSYLDYPEKISRLNGHKEVLAEAAAYREKNQLSFEIWSGNLGRFPGSDHIFTCPKKFQHDSGTTMVAQALHEGRSISVVGFDLGGRDIHSSELESVDKTAWVNIWRSIFDFYGHERVTFIGHDHKPFLLSDSSPDSYARFYMRGKAHISDPEYLAAWRQHTGTEPDVLPWKAEEMVKVKFKNGYETVMRPTVAAILKKKGEIEIIKENDKKFDEEQEKILAITKELKKLNVEIPKEPTLKALEELLAKSKKEPEK